MKDATKYVNTFNEDERDDAYRLASAIQLDSKKESKDLIHFLLYQNLLLEIKIQKLITCIEEVSK